MKVIILKKWKVIYLQLSFSNNQTIKEMINFYLKYLLNSNNKILNYILLDIKRMIKYENTSTFIDMNDVIDILEYFKNNKKYMLYYSIRFLLNNK